MTVYNDPQQELFTRVKLDLEAQGYAVYDGLLPPENTPYPFFYLGECTQADTANKSAVFGTAQLTIHIWHGNAHQRGTVSRMLLAAKGICRRIGYTRSFSWLVTNIRQRLLTDTTTKTPLLHGVLEVEWKFS